MTIQDLGALGELIGSVAVLATLVYLALQTRRTRIATEAQGTMNALTAYSHWRTSLLQNSDTVRAIRPASKADAGK